MKRSAALALLIAPALVLVACSSGTEESTSSSAAPSSSPAASSPAAPSSGEASPSSPETILAVLCDSAAPESVAAIEAKLLPDYKLSQVVDVRTDDAGTHAILGFVEGPGLAVLAQWTGTGLDLEGLAAADEFAAQVTGLPVATPDAETQDLLGQTVTCYTTIHAPDEADDDKKDDKKDE